MRTINIDNKNNEKKLINILQKEFPTLSLNTFYKALRKKDIRVNDVRVAAAFRFGKPPLFYFFHVLHISPRHDTLL